MKNKCPSCGLPWTEHLGIAPTCKNYQATLSALKVIDTWAKFSDGEMLTPKDTLNLIKRTFDKIGYRTNHE